MLLRESAEAELPPQVQDPITADDVQRVFDLADDGFRNYFITLGYWDLSRLLVAYTHGQISGDSKASDPADLRAWTDGQIHKLTVVTDHELAFRPHPLNANFCSYATWSSLTIGRNVRNMLLPQRIDDLRPQLVRQQLTRLAIEARKTNRSRLSKVLALGQRVVFLEIGRAIFDLMALPAGMKSEKEIVEALTGVTPHSSEGMGDPDAELLKQAMASYHLAAHRAANAKQRAELVLRGNVQLGSYEQQRVQQVVDYPLDDFPVEFFSTRLGIEDSVRRGAGRLRRRINSATRRRVRGALDELWSRCLTEELMVLQMGDEIVRLGKDLPLPRDTDTIFPPDLREIEDPALRRLLLRFDHSFGAGRGTGVAIWSDFDDRMNFIVNFMRSRAQYAGLHVRPFDDIEERRLRRGQDPLP